MYCRGLTEIYLGAGVTSIDERVFNHCTSLTNIEVSPDNTYFASVDGNLYNTKNNEFTQYAPGKTESSFVIPDGIEKIQQNAFYGCASLESVTIPESVKSIGRYAFYGCTGLTSIVIPNGVTAVYDYAFYECTGLKEITLSSGLTQIYSFSFATCTSLTNLVIPEGVTELQNFSFTWCDNLMTITIPSSITRIGGWAFNYCENISDVYYNGSEDMWRQITISQSGNEYLLNANMHYSE